MSMGDITHGGDGGWGRAERRWHRACLKCTSCKTTLDPSKISDRDGLVYCKNCYAKVSPGFYPASHTVVKYGVLMGRTGARVDSWASVSPAPESQSAIRDGHACRCIVSSSLSTALEPTGHGL